MLRYSLLFLPSDHLDSLLPIGYLLHPLGVLVDQARDVAL
ncbi:hypothetical protein VCHENC02_4673, partial [Vibrio harveyi]